MKMRSVLLVVAALAVAASVHAGTQQQDRLRQRDGSCKTTATATAQSDQLRQRDRLRDGSCQTTTATADQLRQRDRLPPRRQAVAQKGLGHAGVCRSGRRPGRQRAA